MSKNGNEGSDALFFKLLKTRSVIISQEIGDELTRRVLTELILHEAEDAKSVMEAVIDGSEPIVKAVMLPHGP